METVTLDSGFGFTRGYPDEGEMKILWTLKRGETTVI